MSPKKVCIGDVCPPFLENHLRPKVAYSLERGRPQRLPSGPSFCLLGRLQWEGRGVGLVQGQSHLEMLCLVGFLLPRCQQAATLCLGFKGRGRPLWRSSLGSTGLLTCTVGVTSRCTGLSEGPAAGTWVGLRKWVWWKG